jgi:hypothetical protein
VIQASLVYYPNQANPARAGGKGVWRVKFCSHVANPLKIRVDYKSPHMLSQRFLRLMVAREYKPNSRVDPRKLALEFLRSQQPMLAAA